MAGTHPLAARVTALEARETVQDNRLDTLSTAAATTAQLIAGWSNVVADLTTRVASVEAANVALSARIDALEQGEQPPAPRFPGDPGAGLLYYGMNRQGGNPADREAIFGHPVGEYRSYWEANQSASLIAVCKRDLAAGRWPWASTSLPGPWADVAAGRYDGWLTTLYAGLASCPGPVGLTLKHEPWDDQGTGQTPVDYKAMYAHCYATKPINVALIPIVQSGPFDPDGQQFKGALLADWIDPACADVIGYDIYNHWHGDSGFWKWRDVPSMLSFADLVAAVFPGKPMAVGEYGVRSDPANPGRAAQWMADYKAGLVARGDHIAMSYFDYNSGVGDGGTPWALDYGDTERLDAFKSLLTGAGSAFIT